MPPFPSLPHPRGSLYPESSRHPQSRLDPCHSLLGDILVGWAEVARDRGRFNAAVQLYQRALSEGNTVLIILFDVLMRGGE